MILTAHQPAYLPWLGYFDKIASADVFVFLDTVQFEKNSFINRNRIKTAQGLQWLTVPVKLKGHTSETLRDTKIETRYSWSNKHLKAIEMNYSKAAFFRENMQKLQGLFAGAQEENSLTELCWRHLLFWLKEFGIRTRLVRSSELVLSASKSDLVLEICQVLGADHYVSGTLGRDYLVQDDFRQAGITLEFQNFTSPTYPQLWGAFVPNLSIVDYWLNCGSTGLEFAKGK